MPVMPPTRNVNRNPMAISMAVENQISPRHMVPIQLNILIPVGTAIKKLIKEKNGNSTTPVVNMWCAQTPNESAPMVIVAKTIPLYPKTGLREKTGMISVMMPKNGRARMYTSGYEEARKHRDRTGQVEPVTQRVETRKGHVRRTNLNGHDDVGERAKGEGTSEEVDHDRTVHGEQFVVLRERDQRIVRRCELRSNDFGEGAADHHHDDRGDGVRKTDDLVIGRRDPLQDSGRTVVLFVGVITWFGSDRWVEYVSHQLFPSLFAGFVGTIEDVC